jgi:hypothetical protein
MRIAYLDCFSGLSGDMFLGAAVAAGVPFEKLQAVAQALNIGAELACRPVERAALAATKIDVLIHGHADRPQDLESAHEHSHEHSHSHEHLHSHVVEASHSHRGLPEIRRIIAGAPFSARAQAFALRAFELLAQAEATVHNRDAESIHFHEAGSEDAIVDILCAAVAVEHIDAERWYSSALNVGSGTVRCAHGVLPVPAPATVELLRGAPIFSSGVQKELLTPTGAVLLRALDVRFEPLPPIAISATGYGAGARELAGTPNVVRLTIGETPASATGAAPEASAAYPSEAELTWDSVRSDAVVILEANLDDMNPQLFGYVQQKLLDAGALDAFAVPVQMKKGRPGIILTVIAAPADSEKLSRILLAETTTLGVRTRTEQRRILDRRHVTVDSAWGPIRIKLGLLGTGEVVNCAPEFEDCRRIAEAAGVPLKAVMQEAMRLYLSSAQPQVSGG